MFYFVKLFCFEELLVRLLIARNLGNLISLVYLLWFSMYFCIFIHLIFFKWVLILRIILTSFLVYLILVFLLVIMSRYLILYIFMHIF